MNCSQANLIYKTKHTGIPYKLKHTVNVKIQPSPKINEIVYLTA